MSSNPTTPTPPAIDTQDSPTQEMLDAGPPNRVPTPPAPGHTPGLKFDLFRDTPEHHHCTLAVRRAPDRTSVLAVFPENGNFTNEQVLEFARCFASAPTLAAELEQAKAQHEYDVRKADRLSNLVLNKILERDKAHADAERLRGALEKIEALDTYTDDDDFPDVTAGDDPLEVGDAQGRRAAANIAREALAAELEQAKEKIEYWCSEYITLSLEKNKAQADAERLRGAITDAVEDLRRAAGSDMLDAQVVCADVAQALAETGVK